MPSNFLVNDVDLDDLLIQRQYTTTVVPPVPGFIYTTAGASSPVLLDSGSDWVRISILDNITPSRLAIKADGTLWAQGPNNYGQLGLNDTITRSTFEQVGSDTDWSYIASGPYSFIAIKNNGTIWSWGRNNFGNLGLNNRIDYSSPVQIGSDTNWSIVDGSQYGAMAVKTDGTLWGWGAHYSIPIGITSGYRSSPIQVGSDTDWEDVGLYEFGGHAIKANGTLWGWGENRYGAVGTNSTIDVYTPVQIGSDTNWRSIGDSNYSETSCAIKDDNTLWTWGLNSYGVLGHNTTFFYSSPTQVGSTTDWRYAKAGSAFTFAIKTDGSLWSWGFNSGGRLGHNDAISRSSPAQVGSDTDWLDLDISYYPLLLKG